MVPQAFLNRLARIADVCKRLSRPSLPTYVRHGVRKELE